MGIREAETGEMGVIRQWNADGWCVYWAWGKIGDGEQEWMSNEQWVEWVRAAEIRDAHNVSDAGQADRQAQTGEQGQGRRDGQRTETDSE